jgi:uncharacterized membrane protein
MDTHKQPASGSDTKTFVPVPRIESVDALRGAIMMLMAIDHIWDYVDRSAQQFLPTDLVRTTPAIFFTRWITHFCAPVFMLTSGLGAYFWMTRGNHSKGALSRLLMFLCALSISMVILCPGVTRHQQFLRRSLFSM